MSETAISNIVKIRIIIEEIIIRGGLFIRKFLRRLNNKCPATMFAVNRTDSVMGRIMFLIISIITIKFIRAIGVPVGTMWIIMLVGLDVQP